MVQNPAFFQDSWYYHLISDYVNSILRFENFYLFLKCIKSLQSYWARNKDNHFMKKWFLSCLPNSLKIPKQMTKLNSIESNLIDEIELFLHHNIKFFNDILEKKLPLSLGERFKRYLVDRIPVYVQEPIVD